MDPKKVALEALKGIARGGPVETQIGQTVDNAIRGRVGEGRQKLRKHWHKLNKVHMVYAKGVMPQSHTKG